MIPSTMQAVQVHDYGDVDQLKLETIPVPQPGPRQVLVQVYAIGVMPWDWKYRQGMFRAAIPAQFPYIPGSSIAGVVAAVGSEVTDFAPGQAVFGRSSSGAYAEYALADAEHIGHQPSAMRFAAGATVNGGATTAWGALFNDGGVQAGHRVLVHGAAGGVGAFAVQFARWRGAEVWGTASAANAEQVRAMGATPIDYKQQRFEDAVPPLDMVLDTVGGATLERSLGVLKPGGIVVTLVGQPDAAAAASRGVRATNNTANIADTAQLETIAELIVAGAVQAPVGVELPLSAVREAHTQSQTGHGSGRIILLTSAAQAAT